MIFQLYTPLQGLPGCPNLEGCDAEVDKELGNDGQLGWNWGIGYVPGILMNQFFVKWMDGNGTIRLCEGQAGVLEPRAKPSLFTHLDCFFWNDEFFTEFLSNGIYNSKFRIFSTLLEDMFFFHQLKLIQGHHILHPSDNDTTGWGSGAKTEESLPSYKLYGYRLCKEKPTHPQQKNCLLYGSGNPPF